MNIRGFLENGKKSNGWFEDNIVANAPLIMGVFANLLVLAMSVRAFDVVFRLTGVWWKALFAALSSEVAFLLWEIGWRYNKTTDFWRKVSLVMAGLAFFTSLFLGVADYLNFTGFWANVLLVGVVGVMGVHTIVFLLYYYNDPDVLARRRKSQLEGKMQALRNASNQAKTVLGEGKELLEAIQALKRAYPPEDVRFVLKYLTGNDPDGFDDDSSKQPQTQKQQLPAIQPSAQNIPPAPQSPSFQPLQPFQSAQMPFGGNGVRPDKIASQTNPTIPPVK
jgi:hypothetical protein